MGPEQTGTAVRRAACAEMLLHHLLPIVRPPRRFGISFPNTLTQGTAYSLSQVLCFKLLKQVRFHLWGVRRIIVAAIEDFNDRYARCVLVRLNYSKQLRDVCGTDSGQHDGVWA